MSILHELNLTLGILDISVETGVFKGKAPDEYLVITPLVDTFGFYADNRPRYEVQEVRISLFSKNNYLKRKNQIVNALLDNDFIISDRRYIGFEENTGYHHFVIELAKEYEI